MRTDLENDRGLSIEPDRTNAGSERFHRTAAFGREIEAETIAFQLLNEGERGDARAGVAIQS